MAYLHVVFFVLLFSVMTFAQNGRRVLVSSVKNVTIEPESIDKNNKDKTLYESYINEKLNCVFSISSDAKEAEILDSKIFADPLNPGRTITYDKVRIEGMNGCPTRKDSQGRLVGWVRHDQMAYSPNPQVGVVVPDPAPMPSNSGPPDANMCTSPAGSCNKSPAAKNHADLKSVADVAAREWRPDVGRSPGMKSMADIDRYMQCYPKGGAEGYKRYKELSPFFDIAASTFRVKTDGFQLEANPAMMRCLIRRESGFISDIKAEGVNGGATGLGQHTDINVRHIKQRLAQKGSWERTLWNDFFKKAKSTKEGQALLAKCPQTSGGQEPKFETKEDAKCPLQSMAASHIYNLQVQRELRVSGKEYKNISPEHMLDYQVAVGAAYNVGDQAASSAIEDLGIKGWLKAILTFGQANAKNSEKKKEVPAHILALKNCMQANNWKPMHPNDRPQGGVCSQSETNAAQALDAPNPKPKAK